MIQQDGYLFTPDGGIFQSQPRADGPAPRVAPTPPLGNVSVDPNAFDDGPPPAAAPIDEDPGFRALVDAGALSEPTPPPPAAVARTVEMVEVPIIKGKFDELKALCEGLNHTPKNRMEAIAFLTKQQIKTIMRPAAA